MKDWQELVRWTQGVPLAIERVRLVNQDIALEGSFELPPLARLSPEEQVFVMAFVKCHGSIKEMESLFGISYPTVKNRLNRLGELFPLAEVSAVPSRDEILTMLEKGEITAEEAIERLSK